MHEALQGASFHVEHIHPTSQGGATTAENLALACPSCNLHKSDRTIAVDPESGIATRLFHPRTDNWDLHFKFVDYEVVGVTSLGRATVAMLQFNQPKRFQIRQAEELFGLPN